MNPTDDLPTWAAAYRSAGQPSEALRLRILAAVGDAAPVRVIPLRRPWRDGAIHASVGALAAIAALMLLAWITQWVSRGGEPREDPSAAPYERSPTDAARSAAPRGDASATPPAELAAPPQTDVAPVASPPAAAIESRPNVARPTAPTEPSPPDAGGDLESLRQLRSAKQLLQSDPARARVILEAHARAYPESALALEREALWIRAACLAGAEPTVAERRAAFARRPGIAAYQVAIEQDCTGR